VHALAVRRCVKALVALPADAGAQLPSAHTKPHRDPLHPPVRRKALLRLSYGSLKARLRLCSGSVKALLRLC
jgi:hypothetical protein